ncbi:MAG: hypothetical protein ABFS56_09370 [Pseudomonadota bacterium]
MTLQFKKSEALEYLQKFITHNKARGMTAEVAFDNYVQTSKETGTNKVLDGGWLLSPNLNESSGYMYRYAVFVLPQIFADNNELQMTITEKETDRGFQALSTFLSQSGIGVIISGGILADHLINADKVVWQHFIYRHEKLHKTGENEPFNKWPRGRGRASKGNVWQEDVLGKFSTMIPEQLTKLTLRQAFFYSHIKKRLKIPLADPYDVDAFVVSYTGSVMPVEIKEKSPTKKGYFGIDAGRILMMLRLCLATDSNALYIIREVDESVERKFVEWRFVTLSDMIMGSSWNLQAGGKGMGGGNTQTIMLSASLFETFELNKLSEEWLSKHSSLQSSVKNVAQKLSHDLIQYL